MTSIDTTKKGLFYRNLIPAVAAVLIKSNNDFQASLANVAALLANQFSSHFSINHINWCGFYLLRPVLYRGNDDGKNDAKTPPPVLVLSSFYGQPAVSIIHIGAGVCGTAVQRNKSQLIANVHEIENHIACDSNSNSEIVIPLYANLNCEINRGYNNIIGVLDIDSPNINNFDQEDLDGLTKISQLISEKCVLQSGNNSYCAIQPVVLTREQFENSQSATCSIDKH
jgi:L-methionine (R)-S-oxide reductase